MVKLRLKGEHYIVSREDAAEVRDILGEKGEGDLKIPSEQIGGIISALIKKKGALVEEYAEINGREVRIRVGSPGNWSDFAECLVDGTDTARIAGIVLTKESHLVGVEVSSICTIAKTLDIFTFQDSEIFSNLVQILYEQNIKEVVYEDKTLEKVLGAMGVSHRHVGPLKSVGSKHRSTQVLEKFLNLVTDDYEKNTGIVTETMKMDATVARTLLDGEVSLWEEIKCASVQGKRLLRMFIRLPHTNREEIERRHSIVEEMQLLAGGVRQALAKVPDTMLICKKLEKGTATLPEILKILKSLEITEILLKAVTPVKSMQFEVGTLAEAQHACLEVVDAIHRVIDPETLEIRETYNEKLASLSIQRAAQEKEVLLEYSREIVRSQLQKHKVKLENTPTHGYHLKMPRAELNAISGKGFIQLSAQKSGVLFTTEQIRKLDHAIKTTDTARIQETHKVLSDLRDTIKVYRCWLEVINHLIAAIDVFSSLSLFAQANNLTRPTLTDGEYSIRGAYHPLLPAIHRRQQQHGLTPPEITKNDLALTDTRFCLITGPNMGGKTTFLKTVALISIMAQFGSFVPAEEARIPIFSSLFLRIGASDAPESNISTFMAEMIDISKIVNSATKDSLVIIDELGRGTSDADGYAIAQATTEHIITLGSLTLFATHFYELSTIPGITNKRVGCIQTETAPIMTYRIEDGVGDSSFGLNVAKHTGFPEAVIDMAQTWIKTQEISTTPKSTQQKPNQ
ncbi:DNA mismatch repair protein MSH2 [Nematocida displodere]|uniref:DNA mismatch repair protein MSH2 n=1 Tax=Nematocida displodere TaxID=1805483 RepID=A0A177EDS8_9MICR|nr:DNA mismatch repair protein MSH2 [Nematocida displodere]